MAKMVGYACNVKRQWLNFAVKLLKENYTEKEYKEKLNEYLSFEIDSPTRLRKTREIIMRTWFYDSDEISELRKNALSLIDNYPEYDIIFHYCLLCMAYPVFADICRIMGRLFEYNDELTNTMINKKLYDEWGERGTLQTTARRVTLTLKDLDLLCCVSKTRYRTKNLNINNGEVAKFALIAGMKLEKSAYYTLSSIANLEILFPFVYKISKETIYEDSRFSLSTFNGETSIVLTENTY